MVIFKLGRQLLQWAGTPSLVRLVIGFKLVLHGRWLTARDRRCWVIIFVTAMLEPQFGSLILPWRTLLFSIWLALIHFSLVDGLRFSDEAGSVWLRQSGSILEICHSFTIDNHLSILVQINRGIGKVRVTLDFYGVHLSGCRWCRRAWCVFTVFLVFRWFIGILWG
jgi:hypothetical protein